MQRIRIDNEAHTRLRSTRRSLSKTCAGSKKRMTALWDTSYFGARGVSRHSPVCALRHNINFGCHTGDHSFIHLVVASRRFRRRQYQRVFFENDLNAGRFFTYRGEFDRYLWRDEHALMRVLQSIICRCEPPIALGRWRSWPRCDIMVSTLSLYPTDRYAWRTGCRLS